MNLRKIIKSIFSIRHHSLSAKPNCTEVFAQKYFFKKSLSAIATLLLALTFTLAGCGQDREKALTKAAQIPVDLILHNGKILTIDYNYQTTQPQPIE